MVKKKNIQTNAEIKTISDYALMLQHQRGLSWTDAVAQASELKSEPLFEQLMERNVELFTTGYVVMK